MFARRCITRPSKRAPFLSSNTVDRDAVRARNTSSPPCPAAPRRARSPPPPERTRPAHPLPAGSRDRGRDHDRAAAATQSRPSPAAQGRGLLGRRLGRSEVCRQPVRPPRDRGRPEEDRAGRGVATPPGRPPSAPPRGAAQPGGPRRNDASGLPRGLNDPAARAVDAPKSALARKWAIFDRPTETSDTDLELWGRLYIPGFQGVLPRIEFQEVAEIEPGNSWILNLDRGIYARGGTHWVAVYVSRVRPLILYFDSFGQPPPKEVILEAWKNGRGVSRSDIRYQQFAESNCGPRALAVLHFLAKAPDDIAAFKELAQEDK